LAAGAPKEVFTELVFKETKTSKAGFIMAPFKSYVGDHSEGAELNMHAFVFLFTSIDRITCRILMVCEKNESLYNCSM
jgi:hypothetical protein